MLLVLMVVIGIIANPNTVPQKIDGFEWPPINLYINGDTFYYIPLWHVGPRYRDDGHTA